MSDGDEAARRRIRGSLDESLLVEAAAGTGKTTVLVDRLVAVLESGRSSVDRVVAVTFTRKAAGEMKLRLRAALDRALERARAEPDDARSGRLEAAITRLEEARIGTIHAFCAELLRERPVEARVDPGFRELDEDEAADTYARAFRAWAEQRLDTMPPGLRRALVRLGVRGGAPGVSPLDRIADAGRGLVEWRDYPAPWQRRPFDRAAAIGALVERAAALWRLWSRCEDPRDPLRRALVSVDSFCVWLRRSAAAAGARDDDALEARLLDELLPGLKREQRKVGRPRFFAPEVPRAEVAAARDALIADLEVFGRAADADLTAALREELLEVAAGYEERKRAAGALDFLDLLLSARELMRGCPAVRAHYQDRFSHIFVDEFQDTDPLQAEILLLLAADDPGESDWRGARPSAGKLFLVGDPKQSVYRFRRADVVLYQAVRDQLAAAGVELLHLTRSFRAVRPLQQAINAAFAPAMTGDRATGQPAYVPLAEHRIEQPGQPALVVLPVPRPYGRWSVSGKAIEASLPDAVAAFVHWLVEASGWQVSDPQTGALEKIAPRHVCLLFRRFVSWRRDVTTPYARALEARAIPHLLVGGRSLHQREEVETLRVALTAIEWPDDELAVFATLKRSLLAIEDELLLRFRAEVGSLHPLRPQPPDLDPAVAPVAAALALLASLHRRRNRRPIAATLSALLRATRAHAGFALRPAGHQVLANVQQVAELARRYEQRGGLSFRGFVEWLAAEAERPESRQAAVLEEGAEGVRIMTVHAAKGLEFPVVLLADPTARSAREQPGQLVDAEAGLAALTVLGWAPWDLLDRGDEERAREEAEGLRVAYVAATRARDLLVVPAVGDGPHAGWLSVLSPAIYPPREAWRKAAPATGCPAFGPASVLERPSEQDAFGERSVRPGTHRSQAGEHEVVWWDPAALELGAEGGFGVRQEAILAEDPGRVEADAGRRRYQLWSAAHAAAVAAGSRPSLLAAPVTRLAAPVVAAGDPGADAATRWELPAGAAPEIAVELLPRPAGRSAGLRFGTLVHTVLRDAHLAAASEEVLALTALHARVVQAPAEEEAAAAQAVTAVLAHPLLRRAATAARRHRELPFLLPLGAQPGDEEQTERIVEGTIDLCFLDAGLWTVVDFKTDLAPEAPAPELYQRQLAWYVLAIERLTGQPARGVLLGI